ncbi:MAG: hypothetical protein ACRDPK_13320, partial [Carbonactinosporaceae bacterium]
PGARPLVGGADGAPAARARGRASARTLLLMRRRRTMVLLLLTLVTGTGMAVVAGHQWAWLPGAAGLLLVFYVVHVRVQERRRFEVLLRRRLREDATRRRRRRADLAARIRRFEGDASQEGPSGVPGEPDEPEGDLWQPVPLPLPTYLTAPVAPSPARAIDLSQTTWTSGRSSRDQVFDQYADGRTEPEPGTGGPSDPPRAANE